MSYKIKKGLAYRKIDGAFFIVDAAGSRLHEFNASGSVIWEGLVSGAGEAAIAGSLCGEFEVSGETAREDAASFIKELLDAGLVTAG